MEKIWRVKHENCDDVVTTLLKDRGITGDKEVARFLNPDWDSEVLDPFLFSRMQDAVNRVFLALESEQSILIHGDYDADGVSGTALLYKVLEDICKKDEKLSCKNLEVYLPDREKDGYGIAMHTVERLGKDGVELLITVDCGISNNKELDRADILGMDVIICDHHQLGDALPEKSIILHPLAPGEIYPNKKLCGTGVAFKFATALIVEARKRGLNFPEGYEKWFLDLVAIATVTDVMPILEENRVLEKFGLVVLNKTRRPGLRKIIESTRSELGSIDTQTIGYRIGPRLNAAGRIGSAKIAFDALVSEDEVEAEELANELELLNRERQKISRSAYKEAKILIEKSEKKSVCVVWNKEWHPGIVGLISGKIVTDYGIPAFALTKVGDSYVGSGRSIGGLHLVDAMNSCGDIFIKSGGHPQACGLTIASLDLVKVFEEKINLFADKYFTGEGLKPMLEIDCEVPIENMTWDLYNDLQSMSPFGEGNSRPIFKALVEVLNADAVGNEGKHLRLVFNSTQGDIRNGIAFNFGKLADKIQMGDKIEVVYEPSVNEWNGNKNLQARVMDIKINNKNNTV